MERVIEHLLGEMTGTRKLATIGQETMEAYLEKWRPFWKEQRLDSVRNETTLPTAASRTRATGTSGSRLLQGTAHWESADRHSEIAQTVLPWCISDRRTSRTPWWWVRRIHGRQQDPGQGQTRNTTDSRQETISRIGVSTATPAQTRETRVRAPFKSRGPLPLEGQRAPISCYHYGLSHQVAGG